jgi:thioredoxin 1
MRTAWDLIIAGCVVAVMLLAQIGEAASLDDALAQAKKEGKIVMLELGSVGCIPCEQMRPVMQRLSRDYPGRLEVIFVDIKVDREAGRKFGVFGIPTQVFLDRNGKEFSRHVGFYSYEDIRAKVLKKMGL